MIYVIHTFFDNVRSKVLQLSVNKYKLGFFSHSVYHCKKTMLPDISLYATRIVLTSFTIFGTIGNILNILIFTRPKLLQLSCTIYLFAASIANILAIYTNLLTRLLAGGFSNDITKLSDFLCKFRYYVGYICLAVSPYFLILACFDRYCSSSISTSKRAWCNKKTAIKLCIGAILLACLLYLHMAIFFEIKYTNNTPSCYSRLGAYDLFYRIFYLVIYCLLPSVCMGVLCVLTLKNIRQQVQRIHPALRNGNQSLRRIDQQMIRMLLGQILTQVICILPFAILSLIALFISSSTVVFNFLLQMSILPLYVSYTTSFYIFTLSSRIYRQELKKIICFWKPNNNESEHNMNTINTVTNLR